MKAGTDQKNLYFLLKLFPFLVSDSAYKIRMELNWIENPSQRVSEKKLITIFYIENVIHTENNKEQVES